MRPSVWHEQGVDLVYAALRPMMFALDPERAHDRILRLASFASRHPWIASAFRARYAPAHDPRLEVEAMGLRFPSPLGLAAGLDKDGDAIDFWAALGFGFVEVGTVTPGAGQEGNSPPRLERILEDRAIVNRMGFNNKGAIHLAGALSRRTSKIPVGANIGKAKSTPLDAAPDDYAACTRAVWTSADYIVVNVSSPNTPGLRSLQAVEVLEPLLCRVKAVNLELARFHERRARPILVKIAPDLADDEVDEVARLARFLSLDGIIATNTTIRRDGLSRAPRIEGGTSGAPLAPRALELTRRLYRTLEGSLPIVGVGGIFSAEDAYRRIRAGASLVQIYTGLIYEGPSIVGKIRAGLGRLLEADGFARIADAVGVDVRAVT